MRRLAWQLVAVACGDNLAGSTPPVIARVGGFTIEVTERPRAWSCAPAIAS